MQSLLKDLSFSNTETHFLLFCYHVVIDIYKYSEAASELLINITICNNLFVIYGLLNIIKLKNCGNKLAEADRRLVLMFNF